MKLILLLFIITNTIVYTQNSTQSTLRVVVFNNVGQREKIKSNDKVSVVIGQGIKPEYTYLSYSNSNISDEYIIELKSNEKLFREISLLRNSIDSLKILNKKSPEKIESLSSKIDKQQNTSNAESINNDSREFVADSLVNTYPEDDILTKLPKIKNSIDALNQIKKMNSQAIERNNAELDRNNLRIDTLLRDIDYIKKSGKNNNLLKDYYNELDSLKARNFEIEEINNTLKFNNRILSGELRARNAEYDALLRLIYLISAIAVIVLLVALFIYINLRQKKKFGIELSRINKELEKFNYDLTESNNQKDKLLKVIRKELVTASNYVFSLLPPIGNLGSFKTDWIFKPSEQLGGDAFGITKIDDSNTAFYLLDVSGHGVGAALHSVQVLNILQNQTLPEVDFKDPRQVLNSLNNIFQMNNYSGMYFTICYAVYDSKTSILRYSSAGHPPMLLIQDGGYIELEAQNIFIGAVKIMDYKYDEVKIKKNSSLYMFSDGVFEYEKPNHEMYTFNNFKQDFYRKIEKQNLNFDKFYEFSKSITGLQVLDDDYSILKITFK